MRGVHVWGDMARKGFGKAGATALLLLCVAAPCLGQARVNVQSAYEAVDGSDDWTTLGGQLTLRSAKGSGGWLAVEMLGRYGETDVTERLGGVLHPNDRWWFTLEAGTSKEPLFSPKNSWEADAATLIGHRSSVGLTYRRGNYSEGPVDILIPRFTTETRTMSWTMRVFISRNPSDRTDWAGQLQVAHAFSRRITGSLLGAGGRETYSVAGSLQSLETTTIGLGARYNVANNLTVRLDATFINSQPILSRRGIALGLERGW
jgi:YaiO family outer membrane protein